MTTEALQAAAHLGEAGWTLTPTVTSDGAPTIVVEPPPGCPPTNLILTPKDIRNGALQWIYWASQTMRHNQ